MRWIFFGRQFRFLRIHRDKRQVDVGRAAGLSRQLISRIDRGLIGNIRVADLDRAATALGATLDVRLRWNGEQLDPLLDEAHARLVDLVVTLLRASGWEVTVEVSFSVLGERGSIDVFAYHRATGIVLVVEVKSVVPDQQAALHGLDRKARLARRLAEERGWVCRTSPGYSSWATRPPPGDALRATGRRTMPRCPTAGGAFGGGYVSRVGRSRGCCFSHSLPEGAQSSLRRPGSGSGSGGRA